MLTTVAVPRSARWCEGQCSVPATRATDSQRMGEHARVSRGLPWASVRMLSGSNMQAAV